MKLFTSIIISLISILLGVVYSLNLFGFVSMDAIPSITFWGYASLFLGAANLVILIFSLKNMKIKFLDTINILLIAFIQFAPSILWIVFNNYIAGEYGEKVVARWYYSVPHILLIIICIIYLFLKYKLKNSKVADI